MSWSYRFAGLLFESALPIPEWDGFSCDDLQLQPDVRIALASTSDDSRDGEYRLSVPDVATFQVRAGRDIVVTPAAGVDAALIRVYLLASVLAALFCQRGLLLLHASVVRVRDRTVALCGPTGAGKSTLAAALVTRGGEFVCDDLGRFDVSNGRAVVYPSTPRLKLCADSLAPLAWPTDGLARIHASAVKFHVRQTHRDGSSPVPLDAIYVLEWADGLVAATPLTGLVALRHLVAAATYRPSMLETPQRRAAHWKQCAAVAARARIYALKRPQSWAAISEATDLIGRLCLR